MGGCFDPFVADLTLLGPLSLMCIHRKEIFFLKQIRPNPEFTHTNSLKNPAADYLRELGPYAESNPKTNLPQTCGYSSWRDLALEQKITHKQSFDLLQDHNCLRHIFQQVDVSKMREKAPLYIQIDGVEET